MNVKKIDEIIEKTMEAESSDNNSTSVGTEGLGTVVEAENLNAQVPEEITETVITEGTEADFEALIREIEEELKAPVHVREEVPVEEVPTEEENTIFRTKYEDELSKRIAIQSEKAELEAMVKYQQSLLDKQSDKHLSIIDKQKDLEAELRRAKSAQVPEELTNLVQSFLLYREHNTPVHKYRFLNNLLGLSQNETGISAEEYLQKIILSETKEVPSPDGPVASKVTAPQADNSKPSFMSF